MTRPRAYQVNDPGTHHVRYSLPNPLPTTPSPSVIDLTGSNYSGFTDSTATRTPGGAEEPLPARIVGLQGPFTGITAGESFGIRISGVNGGVAIEVVIQSGDLISIGSVSSLTTAKLASRINATLAAPPYNVSYPVASAPDGYLNIVSAVGSAMTVGADVFVILTEVGFTSGILTRLGFVGTIVTANGSTTTRGIVTKSQDGRGGYFPLRYSNGESVLTQTGNLVSFIDAMGNIRMLPDIVGGQAIYGRLTDTSTPAWRLSFLAQGYSVPPFISNGGNFCSLTGANSVTITISGVDTASGSSYTVSFSVSFGITINSVADVVARINDVWHTVGGGGYSGRFATVISSLPEPYSFNTGDYILVSTDTIPATTVTLGPNENLTAKGVVDIINTALGSTIAQVHTTSGKNYVKLVSVTPGLGSEVTLSGTRRDGINKIGFPYGTVRVSNLAYVYGTSEILIAPPFTDATAGSGILSMNLSGSAMTIMGLVAGTHTIQTSEVSAVPKAWPDPTAVVGIEMLIPEVMELGEVPLDEMTVVQKFINQDTVQQVQTLAGSINANKPVVYDRNGRISKNTAAGMIYDSLAAKTIVIGSDISDSGMPRISIPFAYSSGSTVCTLLYQSSGIPTNVSDPSQITQTLRKYVANDGSYTSEFTTWNAKKSSTTWSKDKTDRFASLMYFDGVRYGIQVHESSHNTAWSSWDHTVFGVNADTPSVPIIFTNNGKYATYGGKFTFIDAYTSASSVGEVYLTRSNNGGNYPRVLDIDASTIIPAYSICQGLNARTYITVGDGISTFGDFNGSDAIYTAINWIRGINSTAQVTIHVKTGEYRAASTIDILNLKVTIIGQPGDAAGNRVLIYSPLTPGDTINVGTSGYICLKNLTIEKYSGSVGSTCSLVLNGRAQVVAEDCSITHIKFVDPTVPLDPSNYQGYFKRCKLRNQSVIYSSPIVNISDVRDGNSIVFEDCDLLSSQTRTDCRMVCISAHSSLTIQKTFGGLKFTRCKFGLSPAAVSGGGSTYLLYNTGLIDLDPGSGTGYQNDARYGTGLVVKSIIYDDCTIEGANGVAGASLLMHLMPVANGSNPSVSPSPFTYVDSLKFIRTSFTHSARATLVNNYPNAFTVTGARRVILEDCVYTLTGSTGGHGRMTQDCASYFDMESDDWASIVIIADDVRIKNLECTGFLHQSGTGDVTVKYYNNVDINGITISEYDVTTSGITSPPDGRVNVFYDDYSGESENSPYTVGRKVTPSGSIKSVKLIGEVANAAQDWCGDGYIRCIIKNTAVSGCSVGRFHKNGPSDTNAFGMHIIQSSTSIYSNYYTISDCILSNCRGIRVSTSYVNHAIIARNSIETSSSAGINLNITNNQGSVELLDNYVTGCTDAGIYISYHDDSGSYVLTNNTCINNDPIDNVQICIRPLGSGNYDPTVLVYGNRCYTFGGDSGFIYINRKDGTGENVLTSNVGRQYSPYYGCETYYNDSGGGNVFKYENGYHMLHNMAYLKTLYIPGPG